jgi:hypothetical protein
VVTADRSDAAVLGAVTGALLGNADPARGGAPAGHILVTDKTRLVCGDPGPAGPSADLRKADTMTEVTGPPSAAQPLLAEVDGLREEG